MSKELPTELLHAYRALLRAATYLPDSACRTYIHNYIVHRFRSARKTTKSGQTLGGEDVARNLGKKRIRYAWRFSRFLERAAQENRDDLKKVLLLTYGRTGKRKRKLIQELIRPEESSLPEDEKALEELIHKREGRHAPDFTPNAKFGSFLRSQVANSPAESPYAKIRHVAAKIPEENIWGRSVPWKLQRSLRKRWWANTLDKILPPIPLHEFNRLRGLSLGSIPIEDPPSRRSRPKVMDCKAMSENNSEVWALLRNPARLPNSTIDEVKFDPEQGLRFITEGETGPTLSFTGKGSRMEKAQNERVHRARSVRRLYASIWNLTSVISMDEVTKLWVTTWGGGRTKAHSGEVTAPSLNDEELFEGLEDVMPDVSQQRKNQKVHRKIRHEEKKTQRDLTGHQESGTHGRQVQI